ncbi:MAG: DUF4105 domain-containing protein [Chitinophagaceae bacterium]
MKKILALLFLFNLYISAFAQTDTCHVRISLLTCGSGEYLYSIWGHTGIRVIDSSNQTDVVFNYGTFDDSDPLFYIKFTRGIMMYSVTPFSFTDFMEEYRYYKRSVTEQVLDLSCTDKNKLVAALWKNAAPENRLYPYHFYADNCTTRARDMLINHFSGDLQFKDIRPVPGKSTYRQLIHSYMNSNSQSWNKLAIDVLLGNHLDEVMNNTQSMFLPDYLMKAFDSASLQQQKLVSQTNVLLKDEQQPEKTFFTPALAFSILFVLMILLAVLKNKTATKLLFVLESVFFLLLGLLGILFVILWLARVDNVCRNNFNLLWAIPTHVIIAFVINKQKNWIKYYWLATAAISFLSLVLWKWLPQEMNNSLLLVVGIILFRSIAHYLKIKKP